MNTQDISLSSLDDHPDLTRADQDCITSAAPSAVIAWLLACRAAGTLTGLGYRKIPSNDASDGWFGTAYWLTRALFAFAASRQIATPTEDANISAWLMEQAVYMATMQDTQLAVYFPSRATGDYSNRAGSAATGENIGKYLYKGGPLIPSVTLNYNNRRAACAHFVGQAGVYFNDAALIASAKRYFKEWVMFGVWGDGVQSEWQRNEGSSAPKQGLVYGTHNITGALEVAARTAAMGDRELADFSTTYGIWGTESATPKTIWTAFDHYLLITQGGRKYVSPDGRRINWWSGETGRSCHWQYCVHAAAQLGRGDRFSTVRQVVTPAGWTEDHYFDPWHGYCGMYSFDVRTVLPPVTQARIG